MPAPPGPAPPRLQHAFLALPTGTSNWSGDYFLHTAGSALVVNQSQVEPGPQPTLREQLQAVFERDWSSGYSQDLRWLGQGEDLCGGR